MSGYRVLPHPHWAWGTPGRAPFTFMPCATATTEKQLQSLASPVVWSWQYVAIAVAGGQRSVLEMDTA